MVSLRPRLRWITLLALAHALVSAVLWWWALAVAVGLGFKDRPAWTAWDHIQAGVVPPLAFILSVPGRFFLDADAGWPGIVAPWVFNSILWATVAVAIRSVVSASKR